MNLLLPGKHRLDGEFGEGLQPRQNRQGETLRHEELRGFRGPGNQHGGQKNGGRSPEHSPRAQFLYGGRGEQHEGAYGGGDGLCASRAIESWLHDRF